VSDHWGSSDSPTPTVPSPFPTGALWLFSSDTVRRLVAQAVSSSRRLAAFPECFCTGSAPNIADIQAGSTRVRLPWSSRSLMTTSLGRIVVTAGLPAPTAFRPRCSSHPRRFIPRPSLRVCFTPQPPPGFTLRGISLPHSRDISSTPLGLLVGSLAPAANSCPSAPRTREPPSRLCSMRKSVVGPTGFSRRTARTLLEFSLLQVSLSLPVPRACYSPLPRIALGRLRRVVAAPGVPRVEN
jgi:hypothetical protein